MMDMATVKKGDRFKVTFRKSADFVPAPGCTKPCCAMETTEEVEVQRVNRKRGTVAVFTTGTHGHGFTFNPSGEHVVRVERVS